MKGKSLDSKQLQFLCKTLKEMLNPEVDLSKLADQFPWEVFEEEFAPLYNDKGRPAKSIHLMVSLLILKHLYDSGDETVIKS
ncbi:MAG: hypothetical protein HQM13_19100 [SAR324 cluster bacterium]|nr:hypothetical protein [SAR324 cluster bacterium]